MAKPLLFASYAREDYSAVSKFAAALRSHAVDVWLDVDALKPGERWAESIQAALHEAKGLLIFVSRHSMRSAWVNREIEIIITRKEMLVIPVILEEVSELPSALQERQWVVLTDATPEKIEQAASLVAGQLHAPSQPTSGLLKPRLEAVTSWVLQKARGFSSRAGEQDLAEPISTPGADAGGPSLPSDRPNSVFVVHGHDTQFSDEVVQCLRSLNVAPVLLSRIGGAQQSLFQKFLNSAGEARFAVVLLSGDDFGASRVQYEAPGVGQQSLQYRARQNVIFELGFFYGRLGWENVFVVYKPPPMVFPNFEHPSDLLGTVFDHVDETGAWRQALAQRLANAGFCVRTSVSA